MSKTFLCIIFCMVIASFSYGQALQPNDPQRKLIEALIDQYSKARETRDTALLKNILTTEIDQLVSTGEWRSGMASAVQGMLNSSASNPGTRTLTVDKVRLIAQTMAIVDCRYIIQGPAGAARMMWSTFIVVNNNRTWKITAIRNMLPAANN